jgi:adenine phosphoribosyltransferase
VDTYSLTLAGLTRQLPIVRVSPKMRMANFSLLGDVELVERLITVFVEKLQSYQFDYLVCPEVKVVPLVHGIAKRLHHKRFIVCRKSIKPYMVQPTILKPLDHFPKHVKPLVLDGPDRERIFGKRVVIVDAVTSTGVTMRMMNKLMMQVNAHIVCSIVVLKQGIQFDDMPNLLSLAEVPVLDL